MSNISEVHVPDAEKVVLITGAAQRIGRAIAMSFAERAWRVVIHYNRSGEAADRLATDIRQNGGWAATLRADLGDCAALERIIGECAEIAGAPVCLINNASIFLNDAISNIGDESWAAHMNVNLRAPIFMARDFAANLPVGTQGNIINIVDQRVLRPSPDFFSYSVSKSGLWWATQTMAQALAPEIRVNAIAPGPVLESVHQTKDEFEAEQKSTLLQRGVQPEEIAGAVHFILATPGMTGQMICVDGGQHLAYR